MLFEVVIVIGQLLVLKWVLVRGRGQGGGKGRCAEIQVDLKIYG